MVFPQFEVANFISGITNGNLNPIYFAKVEHSKISIYPLLIKRHTNRLTPSKHALAYRSSPALIDFILFEPSTKINILAYAINTVSVR